MFDKDGLGYRPDKKKDQKDYSLGHPRTKSREEKKGEEEELPVTHKNVKGHNEEPSDCARSAEGFFSVSSECD